VGLPQGVGGRSRLSLGADYNVLLVGVTVDINVMEEGRMGGAVRGWADAGSLLAFQGGLLRIRPRRHPPPSHPRRAATVSLADWTRRTGRRARISFVTAKARKKEPHHRPRPVPRPQGHQEEK
jgi:hypothetical protein